MTNAARNIAETLDERAAAAPAQIAVCDPRGDGTYAEVTYDHLARSVRQKARALLDAGIAPGMRVAVMVPPGMPFFTLTFALFRMGAVPVFIDPGMGARSLKRCLAEAAPAAFVGVAKAHLARLVLGWERGKLETLLHVGDAARWLPGVRGLGAADATDGREAPVHVPAPDATAAILFTSGSTGAPKGAVYCHANFLAQIAMLRATYGIEPGERDLCTFPLFALFAPALGMTAIVPEMDFTRPARVDPERIFGPIKRYGVTNLFGSPALLRRLARAGAGRGVTLPTLKRVLSAGAPVPAKTLAEFQRLLAPEAYVHTPYGATEALPVASISSREVLTETAAATEDGRGICVGRPVAGVGVRIMKISDAPVATWRSADGAAQGEIGEIVVAGPQVTAAYYGRPEATALAKIKDPDDGETLHRMGDLGYLDGAGRLWFCGRKSHRVATAHGELYTIPCEAIFNRHAAVHRTALVGRGAAAPLEPVLCVEPERALKGKERDRLQSELLALGRAHGLTRTITEIRFFKALPVDTRHNAKIFRERLKVQVDAATRSPLRVRLMGLFAAAARAP